MFVIFNEPGKAPVRATSSRAGAAAARERGAEVWEVPASVFGTEQRAVRAFARDYNEARSRMVLRGDRVR